MVQLKEAAPVVEPRAEHRRRRRSNARAETGFREMQPGLPGTAKPEPITGPADAQPVDRRCVAGNDPGKILEMAERDDAGDMSAIMDLRMKEEMHDAVRRGEQAKFARLRAKRPGSGQRLGNGDEFALRTDLPVQVDGEGRAGAT